MIVVDLEASGVDPEKHSILSIGAVDFENPSDTFSGECQMWNGAHVDPEALVVNGFTEEQARDKSKKSEGDLVAEFLEWIGKKDERTVAGQNPHFDTGFLRSAARRAKINFNLAYREIDLHSIVYFHMKSRGLTPPVINNHSALGSDTIMQYLGMPTEPKPHIALNGAIWETEAFSRLFNNKSLLPQFKQFPVPWVNSK